MIALAWCPSIAASAQLADNAGVLSSKAAGDVNRHIDEIRQKTGRTVTVEIYPEVPADRRQAFESAS